MLRDLYAAIADKLISLMGSALAVVNFVRIAWQCSMGQFGSPLTVSNNENKCAGEKNRHTGKTRSRHGEGDAT